MRRAYRAAFCPAMRPLRGRNSRSGIIPLAVSRSRASEDCGITWDRRKFLASVFKTAQRNCLALIPGVMSRSRDEPADPPANS